MLRLANSLHKETGIKNLCLSGGVALNCVGNGRVLREGPFPKLWIQPAAGDAGSALGAALNVHYHFLDQPRHCDGTQDAMRGTYLGPSFTNEEIEGVLQKLEAPYERFDDAMVCDRVAAYLAEEKVIGWLQGRMEFGPRSLGGRSILGDPRSEKMQSIMNLKIKYRESFRPFAPSVLRECVSDYFEMDTDSPYMLLVAPVVKQRRVALQADQEKLSQALGKLMQEDPSFRVNFDEETGQTLISGMGELHLDIIVDRLVREFKVEANVGKPQVAYRETIRKKVPAEAKFVRQSGGRGQYGHVVMEIEPLEMGGGFEFESKIVGGSIPKEYIKPVEKGVQEALDSGVLAGYPMVDVKATLLDGSYHEVDSSEVAFKVAGSMAFKAGAAKAGAVILEPVMAVEVVTPEDYMGDVIGDLNSRRGRIESMQQRGNVQVISSKVPLSDMFGYATDLRSKTQGRATYTMQFDHYEEVPKSISEAIIAKVQGA